MHKKNYPGTGIYPSPLQINMEELLWILTLAKKINVVFT